MFKITRTKLLFNFLMLFVLALGFYACQQEDTFSPQEEEKQISLFDQHLEDNTQTIQAQDLGNGQYVVTGEQGTRIEIDNALVNATGERVRGDIDIVLIEIYSQADMILNRKQTLADYNGQNVVLESGGEIFIQVYQNGEELSADGNGEMNIFLPTENTGGAKEGMELFYGEEVGDQVIWKPTGVAIKVVNTDIRNGGEYLAIIQNTLGWINVDIIYGEQGEEVECVEVRIDCDQFCEIPGTGTATVALHLSSANSAFELQLDPTTGTYLLCGEGGQAIPIGGLQVTFIVVIECPEGGLAYVALVTVTINIGYHLEVITCSQFQQMDPAMFQQALLNL